MVAGVSGDGRLEKLQLTVVGIEPGTDSQRQRPLRLDVTNGKAVRYRNAQWAEIHRQNLVKSECTIAVGALELGKPADQYPAQAGESTCEAQVRQHAVHSIEVLTNILQEKESTPERWEELGTEQTL